MSDWQKNAAGLYNPKTVEEFVAFRANPPSDALKNTTLGMELLENIALRILALEQYVLPYRGTGPK